MTTAGHQYQSDWALGYFNEGKAEGEAEGKARMLLLILGQREVPISDHALHRITECADLEQLETWGKRALSITDADQLFD